MGPALCGGGSWQTSPKRFAKQDSDDQHGGFTVSIAKFIRPTCMWRSKKNKITQLHQQEKQQQLLKNVNQFTLEDWLLASPGLNNGGDFHVFKQFSNRVHPSLGEEDLMIKSRSMESSSLSRSQSGKRKKKVSFRLPEVADIIIIDSR
ncbi:unnamed protein product [Camellia sinensis]